MPPTLTPQSQRSPVEHYDPVTTAVRRTMNLEQLAKTLGISRSVAYDLAHRDELPVPVIRLGRRMVFSVASVDALLAQTKIEDRQTA